MRITKKLLIKYYQIDTSILNNIPNFGIITGTPIDYMHLVCIGVLKKLITLCLCLDGPRTTKLTLNSINIKSERLLEFQSYTPNDFLRNQGH